MLWYYFIIARLVVKYLGQISLLLGVVVNSARLRLVQFYCHST